MTDSLNWRELPEFPAPPAEDLLPPDEGSTSKKLMSVLAPVRSTQRKSVSIEDARLIIKQRIFEYLEVPEPDYALLVNAPAGVGKTTISIGHAEDRAIMGKKIFYLGPRHTHYDDVLRASWKINPAHRQFWLHWWPRQYEDIVNGRAETCMHTERQNQWMAKGWEAMKFCLGVCKTDYMNNHCPFHAQKKQLHEPGHIVYGQHLHLFTGHPVPSDIVFVDENPMQSIKHLWKVPWRDILPNGGKVLSDDLPVKAILIRLRELARDPNLTVSGRNLMDLLGGGEVVGRAIRAKNLPPREIFQPMIRDVQDADKAFYSHMWDLCGILEREADAHALGRDYPHRIVIDNQYLYIRLRRPVHASIPKHVICLDATGRGDLYERVLGRRVEVVSPDIQMQGHITQVWTSGWGKTQLIDSKDNIDGVHAEKIQAQINKIASQYESVGLITHNVMDKILAPDNCVEYGHFSAERGTNRFEDVPCMITAGTPQPSLQAMEEFAMVLYPDRMEPFKNAEGKYPWIERKVSYDYVHEDGHGKAIDTAGFWDDPDFQMVVWQLREAELIQSIHRARPLLRSDVKIFNLSNIPLEGIPLAHLISTAELMNSPVGTSPYVWRKAELFAEQRHDEAGASLTINDLIGGLKIKRDAASKVLHGLARSGHWRWLTKEERAKSEKRRGKQELVIVPC